MCLHLWSADNSNSSSSAIVNLPLGFDAGMRGEIEDFNALDKY